LVRKLEQAQKCELLQRSEQITIELQKQERPRLNIEAGTGNISETFTGQYADEYLQQQLSDFCQYAETQPVMN